MFELLKNPSTYIPLIEKHSERLMMHAFVILGATNDDFKSSTYLLVRRGSFRENFDHFEIIIIVPFL